MRYREARLLKEGDEVIRKEDQVVMIVLDAQAFGQYKKVMLTCHLKEDESKKKLVYYNDSIKGNDDEGRDLCQ